MSTEASRFEEAFKKVLERDPSTPPGPTAINKELMKPPPLNILNGRMNTLRRRLLEEHGFVQDEKWGRWYRPQVEKEEMKR